MNTSPDHPDFTALALGEHIHGTPAQAVIEALRSSVAARSEADQIRATGNQLAFVLKGQPPLRLDDARRNAIFTADIAKVRARFAEEDRAALAIEPPAPVGRAPRTWVYPTLAAAAVAMAAIMVMKFLPGATASSQPNPAPVVQTDDELTGQLIVVPAPTQSPGRERTPGPSRAPAVVDHEVKPPLPQKGQELSPAPKPPSHLVRESPPAIPQIPAPQAPASNSLPPEAVDPSAVRRKHDPGKIAAPPRRGK